MWILQGTSPYVSTILPKNDLTHWIEFAAPSGATGPTGAAGPTGATGALPWVVVTSFGATGNGSTDDTTSFRNAITSLGAKGGTVYVPAPTASYKLSGLISVPANVSIVGDPNRSAITTAAGTYTLFSIAGSFVTISNLRIDNTAKTGGVDISIDVGSNGPGFGWTHLFIENIYTVNSYGIIADSGSGNGLYQDLIIKRIWGFALRGNGFSFTRSFGSLVLEDCTAGLGASTNPNFTVFALDNSALSGVGAVGGATFSRCYALGTSTNGTYGNQGGFYIANTAAIWISDCDADSLDYTGMAFMNVSDIFISNSNAGLCNNSCMWFVNCSNSLLSGVSIEGRNANTGITGATANISGIEFASGNANMSVVGCNIVNCTGDGINIPVNAGSINISGGQIKGCTGYGIRASGTSAVLASGLTLVGNTTGNYFLGGIFHYLQVSQLNSGAVVSVGPGPVSG